MKSLTVQSVLYNNNFEALFRSVASVANACELAVIAGALSEWEVSFGDCSPLVSVNSDQIEQLTVLASQSGGKFVFEFFDANLGHGGGQNKLSEKSDYDLFFFLNPDIVVSPSSIIELLKKTDGNFGATDASQLPLEHPKFFDQNTFETSWASGAALLTSADLFKSLGGFDHETFFMYCDDVDYSWRVKLAGKTVTHTPTARVFHDKRLEINGHISASITEKYYSAEAALMLAYKYSRHKLVKKLIRTFASSNDEFQLKALEEFLRRRDNSLLPETMDHKNIVGFFRRGNYAKHRY